MFMLKHYIIIVLKSIMAGLCIVVGSTGYLILKSQDMMVIGALVFALGLYAIIHFNLWLYTSKISYVVNYKRSYSLDVFICLIVNLLSVVLFSFILKQTRLAETLIEVSKSLVETKMNDSWYSILILSFMCGGMIYLAVNGHNKCDYGVGKVVFVLFSIMIFIICGYEHVVANACYFTYAGVISWKVVLWFVIMAVGNALGAIFIQVIRNILDKLYIERAE